MRLVALLSARMQSASAYTPDELRIGVHLPIEHQARQAVLAGAEQLLFRADTPTGELVRLADRLTRETGVPVALVGDGPELARRLEKDDRVLLLAAQTVIPQSSLGELATAPAPSLLVTPTEPVTEHLERIDGRHVWAGGALLPGETVLLTVDMLGEWDLELTLLRRAVQQNARRIELSPDMTASGQLVRIETRGDAERAMAVLSQGGSGDAASRDGLTIALAPIARHLVALLTRLQVNPDHLGWASGGLAVLGVATASVDWPRIALVFALLAEGALGLQRRGAQVILRPGAPLWLQVLTRGATLAVLAVIGGRLAAGGALALAGVVLPLALIAAQNVADVGVKAAPAHVATPWTRFTGAMASIVALGGLFAGATVEAFILVGLCAFGTVAARLLVPEEKRI
jgi:hypothetical protein